MTGRVTGCRRFWSGLLIAALLLVLSAQVNAVEDDDFLRAIEMEAEKVGQARQPVPHPQQDNVLPASPVAALAEKATSGTGLAPGLSMDAFEQLLADKYAGSSVFYRKLSLRQQEEIYDAYLSGMSIKEIRKKIVQRYLNR